VFASIFLFFVSASSKQKKKVIFHLVTVSNHISILKRKTKEKREGLIEIWRIIQFLPQKHNSWRTIRKPPLNPLGFF
jgi:hypothetical protein